MKLFINIIGLLLGLFFIVQTSVSAKVSSMELIEKAKKFDRQTITFEGEVIGDVMKRGNHAWVNLSDGNNAVGIWMIQKQMNLIKNTGSYDCRGDILLIKGVFHRSCPLHGGDLDIHAESVKVVKAGHAVFRPVKKGRIILAIFTLFIAGFLFSVQPKKSLKNENNN